MSFTQDAAQRPFEGQVALVTGAARPRSIGRATALHLARGGAAIGCLDIARPYDDAPAHGTASGDDLATLAAELGPSGISVNAVCPGTVDTDLVNKDSMFEVLMGGSEGLATYIAREIPLGRLQDAEEIAAAICWLLSSEARGVTGEALNVSAGQTMV